MFLLLVVSFVWAFSFGLIKGRLNGVDPTAVATLRLVLALLVFLPFLRVRKLPARLQFTLALIGAVQFGIMYVVYIGAFAYLKAFEVALLTITTPMFVALIDGAVQRRFVGRHAVAALLSVAGAAIIVAQRMETHGAWIGIVLVQISNVCFAAGQVAWRQVRAKLDPEIKDASVFGLLYAGAFAASAVWSLFTTNWTALNLTLSQDLTLLYLGVLASGVCFFWWNIGATKVNAGTLATFNNLKIPLAVACSLLFFGERTNVPKLIVGGLLIVAGVVIAESKKPKLGRQP